MAMAVNVYSCGGFFNRFKPHILMSFNQLGSTFMYFITQASFNYGMNPHVHVTYRQIVAGVVMFPFAYFLERNMRPRITVALFLEISVLSLLGGSLTLNMYFASLTYTSPTFLAAMVNIIACLTFVIAIVFRIEVVDLRNPRGIAKVLGTLISLGGVMIMTFYKGSIIRNLGHPLLHIQYKAANLHEDWVKGSILTVSSCISWASYFIMQEFTLKRYPAPLSLTAWMNIVGAAQSCTFTVLTQHKPGAWTVGLNIDLWCILYTGIVCSALIIYIQLWCTEEKGPVFVTMFTPLSATLVAVLAYFVFGQKLYMGSIVGGGIVIVGLYLLLWGKEHDQKLQNKPLLESDSVLHESFKQSNLQIFKQPLSCHCQSCFPGSAFSAQGRIS